MAADCYPMKYVSGVSRVKVCDSKCPGVTGTIGGAGHIYPTARGEQPALGVTDGLYVQYRGDGNIYKEATDEKRKETHTLFSWGGRANSRSRTEGLTCSMCDNRTGCSLFCRGSAAVRNSWGIESSLLEVISPVVLEMERNPS